METALAGIEMSIDEVAFLNSRGHLRPMSEALAAKRLEALVERAELADRSQAQESFEQGLMLLELYKRHAERALGYRSFNAMLRAHWPLSMVRAYERMRLAFFYTCDEIQAFGEKKALLGLRLLKVLGLFDFDAPADPSEDQSRTAREAVGALQRTPLRLRDGSTVMFPSTVANLEEALWVLWNPPLDDDAETPVGRRLLRLRGWLHEAVQVDEELAALKPTASIDGGEVSVRVSARGRKGAAAAAKLYAELAKRR